MVKNLEERVEIINERQKELSSYSQEISKLKTGSRAMMEQITTISKMRIYRPKTSHDLLYGIKFSDGAMDKINEKLNDIYERIVASTDNGIIEEWGKYIQIIDQQDGDYKNWIKEHLARVGQKYRQNRGEDQSITDVENIFNAELLKLLEREIHYSMGTLYDENGNLVIRTYVRVFDKNEQKYIEDLDHILDSVIQIEFKDEQQNENVTSGLK